ncbi:immunoglobulin domain-containing protein, partial [Pontibacter actiniarum]
MRTIFTKKFIRSLYMLLMLIVSGTFSHVYAQKSVPVLSTVDFSCVTVNRGELTLKVTGSNFDTKAGNAKTDGRFRLNVSNAATSLSIDVYPEAEGFTAATATFKIPSTAFTTIQVLSVTVQNANGNSGNYKWEASVPQSLFVIGPPTAQPVQSCPGQVTLSASGAPAGASYKWYRPDGTVIIGETGSTYTIPNQTASASYYVAMTAPGGCESTRTPVTATVNPTATVVITNPAAVCSPATVDLTAEAIKTGSTSGLTYTYFTDATATTALANPGAVAASGTYYIKGTNSTGCSDIKPVTVTIKETITVTAGRIAIDTEHPEEKLEVGKPATFTAESEITTNGYAASYKWYTKNKGVDWVLQPGASLQTFSVASVPSESYEVRVDITPNQETACFSGLPASGIQSIETGV